MILLLAEILLLSVLVACVVATVARAFDKWRIEEKYYMTDFYHKRFAPPYCMFCFSFWVAVVVVLVLNQPHLFTVPLAVPAIFAVLYR